MSMVLFWYKFLEKSAMQIVLGPEMFFFLACPSAYLHMASRPGNTSTEARCGLLLLSLEQIQYKRKIIEATKMA